MVAEENNVITNRRKNVLRPILFFTITTGVLLLLLICFFSSTTTTTTSTFLSDDGTSTTTSSSNSKDDNSNNNNNDIIRQRRRLTATKTTTKTTTSDDYEIKAKEDHYPLFSVSDSITPIGPSVFPKPTYVFHNYDHNNNNDEDKDEGEDEDHRENENENIDNETEIVTYIKPISGVHRPNQDAVFVFAAEYSFETYILFLMTLFETGYTGDVVVGISIMDWEQKDIREILEYWNNNSSNLNSNSNNGDNDDEKSIGMNIIVYVVPYHCYNLEGEELKSHKGGMRVCQCHNLFGSRSSSSSSSNNKELLTPLLDKRHGRTAQTIRYEIYWIWSEYYSPHNWILLIDARDTIFQETPFGRVPRQKRTTTTDDDDDDDNDDGGGSLIFFGENVDATSLGKSKYNRKWLQLAYGDVVADAFSMKPTICSGSTMGEQIAIEMYLRAMVGESDESKTVIFGADQGFHNYLYYSNKLVNTKAIKQILVQDQGFGIINNMGALRDKELSLWGNGKIVQQEQSSSSKNIILNWDGTISPIVHQYDRHKELSQWWHKVRFNQFKDQWRKMKQDKKR